MPPETVAAIILNLLEKKNSVIDFTYFQQYRDDLIVILATGILSAFFSYYILLFTLIVVIGFFIQIPLIRNNGEELLDEIVASVDFSSPEAIS